VAVGRRRVPNGSVEVEERVDLNAECTEFAEKDGTPHPGCFAQRVRKYLKQKGLRFCVVQKSA
jgi:hypothetical protein